MASKPYFDFYLILDFEATCYRKGVPQPQEIIEFPVLKVNAKTLETEAVFHHYVGPTVHPQLTAFCTELTGITQDMVDGQPDLETTLKNFDIWASEHRLFEKPTTSCFVTCGDWDLNMMLPKQCSHFKLKRPSYFKQWINIKKVFQRIVGKRATGMPMMLSELDLTLDGRHHSGIDDCKNIAKILAVLANKCPDIRATGMTT